MLVCVCLVVVLFVCCVYCVAVLPLNFWQLSPWSDFSTLYYGIEGPFKQLFRCFNTTFLSQKSFKRIQHQISEVSRGRTWKLFFLFSDNCHDSLVVKTFCHQARGREFEPGVCHFFFRWKNKILWKYVLWIKNTVVHRVTLTLVFSLVRTFHGDDFHPFWVTCLCFRRRFRSYVPKKYKTSPLPCPRPLRI